MQPLRGLLSKFEDMYAIVDIETTGGHPASNRITEISIILHNGNEIEGRFETLVNPGIPIPYYIQSFTGITNDMVNSAPSFSEIASEVHNKLKDRIFVAHNVNFDFSFIKNQLLESNLELNTKKLCTVRLSRKLVPGYKSYSLGNICAALSINVEKRHRAGGDADATAKLFEHLVKIDAENVIQESLKKTSKEHRLPANLDKEVFEKLPAAAGVYYFLDQKSNVIYVGKAKNIKSRVSSHFSGKMESKQKQNFLRDVHGMSYKETGNELLGGVLESSEIKKLWPDNNKAQKKFHQLFGLFDYQDQNGKIRFGIDKLRKEVRPLITFPNYLTALNYMSWLIDEYGLCPKLCNRQNNQEDCISLQKKICDGYCLADANISEYNRRAEKFFKFLESDKKTLFIVERGRRSNEQCVIVYEPGVFVGYNFMSRFEKLDFDSVRFAATPLKLNPVIDSIISSYLSSDPNRRKIKVYTQLNIAVSC